VTYSLNELARQQLAFFMTAAGFFKVAVSFFILAAGLSKEIIRNLLHFVQ
jgi:hypothetical protein